MNSDFKRLRRAKADFVVDFEREWSDQRRIAIEAPLEVLAIDKTDPIAAQLHTRIQDEFLILDSAGPLRPNTKTGWSPSAKKSFENLGGWATLSIDPSTGAMSTLRPEASLYEEQIQPLALLRYKTLTQADFGLWQDDYLWCSVILSMETFQL